MKDIDPNSLLDLDPGPWRPDPETDYWATESGLVAIPGYTAPHTTYNRWSDEYIYTTKYRKPRLPSIHKNPKGYLRCPHQLVHRVVARAWIPNPSNKPQVHHIDHCKHNNHVTNLKWVTNSENVQDAWDFGLIPRPKQNSKGRFTS